MKKKKLCYLGIILGIIIIVSIGIYLWYFINIQKPKNEGITYLKEKNYTNALNKFNAVLSKDNDNSEAINLKELSENCIVISNEYNDNDFPSVIKTYNKVKDNSNFSLVNININEMYNLAKNKPDFRIKYAVYGSDQYANNNYYEDDRGEIKLVSYEKSYWDENDFVVDTSMPSNVLFQIENTGIDPAEDLVLNLKFNNMAIEFEGGGKWTGVSNLHGIGLWNEIKFTSKDELLYKDMPIKFTLCFAKSVVGENASIDITVLAKDCTPKKFTIPVKAEYIEEIKN